MTKQSESMVNLNKYLASVGIGSRRYCDTLIKRGDVTVNGKIAGLGMKIAPQSDQIALKGSGIIRPYDSTKYYLMLNKPCGYLTTMSDPFNRPTIKELIPEIMGRIYPVGRLDFNSEGLLLITNDGDLAYRLTHPSFMVPKTYKIKVKGRPCDYLLKKLKKGIRLKDGWASIDTITPIRSRTSSNTWFKLSIHGGKNRIIRRLFEKVGHPVLRLKRISLAGIDLGTLEPSKWRYLTQEEIRLLKGGSNG